MTLIDFAEPALLFEPEQPVSKVISAFVGKKKSSALVFKNKEYLGIVWARELAKRKINEPEKTEVKNFVNHLEPLSPETTVHDAINTFLINDLPSVPLVSGGKYYILDKLGLLKAISKEPALKAKTAEDVMKSPFCVSTKDSIATAMSVLRDTGVSRLPVIDDSGRLYGLVDITDFLKADVKRDRTTQGEMGGRSDKMRDVSITFFAQKAAPTAPGSTKLNEIVNMMVQSKTPAVVIVENEKVEGIVTPNLILKTIGKEVKGISVTVSGIQDLDLFMKSVIDEQLVHAVQKWGKFVPIDHIVVHVDRHNEEGKIKWSIKARVIGQKGMFFADDHAWDITKAMRYVLAKLEKEIMKRRGKIKTLRKNARPSLY